MLKYKGLLELDGEIMLEWLKYTFGSFFFNKVSKDGANRSLWNVIFALFMLLMILTAFCSTGFNYSFSYHYLLVYFQVEYNIIILNLLAKIYFFTDKYCKSKDDKR